MTYCFFLQMTGNLALIFALSSAFLCMTSCSLSIGSLLFLALCSSLGFLLGSKHSALRFLPIVLMPLAFWGVQDIVTGAVVLLAAGYCAFTLIRSRFEIIYAERYNFFFLSLKVLLLCFFPLSIFTSLANLNAKVSATLSFVLVFVLSTLMLTQMLRHDAAVICQPRFLFSCIGLFSVLILVILLFQSKAFFLLVFALIKAFYRYLIMPILMLLAYLIGGLIWLVLKPFFPQLLERANSVYETFGYPSFGSPSLTGKDFAAEPTSAFAEIAGTVLSAAALIICILLIARMIKKKRSRLYSSSASLVRTTLHAKDRKKEESPADLVPPTEPRQAVRYYYRCFLRICAHFGMELSPDCNSAMVEHSARQCFQPESADKLHRIRTLYLKARYSEHTVSQTDVRECCELYQSLKAEEATVEKQSQSTS